MLSLRNRHLALPRMVTASTVESGLTCSLRAAVLPARLAALSHYCIVSPLPPRLQYFNLAPTLGRQ